MDQQLQEMSDWITAQTDKVARKRMEVMEQAAQIVLATHAPAGVWQLTRMTDTTISYRFFAAPLSWTEAMQMEHPDATLIEVFGREEQPR